MRISYGSASSIADPRMPVRRDDSPNEPFDDGPDDDLVDGEDDDHEDADRARFSSDTAYCPECGATVLDDADICPKCFTWIAGDTSRHGPAKRATAARFRAAVVWILIAVLLAGAGVLGLIGAF